MPRPRFSSRTVSGAFLTRRAHAILALTLAACAEPPPPVAPPVIVTLPSPTASAAPSAVASVEPAPSAAPDAGPPEDGPRHRVALTLRPGDPPCTLVLDGGLFKQDADSFVITGVSRLATEAGGACAESVFWELRNEKKQRPEDPEPEGLMAGPFLKPSRPRPADYDAEDWNRIEDLDFDGYADLCVVVMTGSYNYSQKCWLFDPGRRTFVRARALDPLIFMTLHPATRTITTSQRLTGPHYGAATHGWEKGKLVTLEEVYTVIGERPDGKPLPPGFTRWKRLSQRRGGRLVKVSEGPERDPP